MLRPFLTKNQQESRNKERADAFFKDYEEVCKKHTLKFEAAMRQTKNALLAVLTLVEYVEEKPKV